MPESRLLFFFDRLAGNHLFNESFLNILDLLILLELPHPI